MAVIRKSALISVVRVAYHIRERERDRERKKRSKPMLKLLKLCYEVAPCVGYGQDGWKSPKDRASQKRSEIFKKILEISVWRSILSCAGSDPPHCDKRGSGDSRAAI
ncbi:uncharacterized protein PHA67_002300 isoform 1-T2 [Liasis olivaceus]